MEEALKPKRGRPKKLELEISDAELNAYLNKMIKQSQEPLHLKIWNWIVEAFTVILQVFAVIIGFIIGLGGCILEFLWIAIAFIIGWWVLTGLYYWIF